MKFFSFLFSFLCWLNVSWSQTTISDFSLPNAANNSMLELSNCRECVGVAIIFSSNECAFDEYYRDRILDLSRSYAGTIQFLLINSHPEPEESLERMQQAYRNLNLTIPYLADKDQVIMNQLGARKSPEAFLLKKTNGVFTVQYSGAIDDNPQLASGVRHPHLKTAIDNMIAGRKLNSSTRAVGCTIRTK